MSSFVAQSIEEVRNRSHPGKVAPRRGREHEQERRIRRHKGHEPVDGGGAGCDCRHAGRTRYNCAAGDRADSDAADRTDLLQQT